MSIMDIWKRGTERQWLVGGARDMTTNNRWSRNLMIGGAIFTFFCYQYLEERMERNRDNLQKHLLHAHHNPDSMPYLKAVAEDYNEKVFKLRRKQLGLPEQPPSLLEIRDPEESKVTAKETTSNNFKLPW